MGCEASGSTLLTTLPHIAKCLIVGLRTISGDRSDTGPSIREVSVRWTISLVKGGAGNRGPSNKGWLSYGWSGVGGIRGWDKVFLCIKELVLLSLCIPSIGQGGQDRTQRKVKKKTVTD